jgi:hypothetical protein
MGRSRRQALVLLQLLLLHLLLLLLLLLLPTNWTSGPAMQPMHSAAGKGWREGGQGQG